LVSQLPASLDDDALEKGLTTSTTGNVPTHIDYAIHFFRLAILNSEIKYVLHSVKRNIPSYAYAPVRDITQWQDAMKTRLDEWCATIPRSSAEPLDYGAVLCRIRYHTLKMSLFLPTPGIPNPRAECWHSCYESSIDAIRLFDELYTKGMLTYDWSTCHAVILHAFCLLYCATAVPQIADKVCRDSVLDGLRAAGNILSATGEYWAGAKRTRDLLEELASKALRQSALSSGEVVAAANPRNAAAHDMQHDVPMSSPSTRLEGNFLSAGAQWQQPSQPDPMMSLFGGLDYTDGTAGLDYGGFEFGSLFADAVDFSRGNSYLETFDFSL
jgi:hypothetical protein